MWVRFERNCQLYIHTRETAARISTGEHQINPTDYLIHAIACHPTLVKRVRDNLGVRGWGMV